MRYKKGMTISEVLADCLEGSGLTQNEAAKRLGVQQSVISRWVSGKDTPSDKYVPAIVKFTGITRAQALAAIHQQRFDGRVNLGHRVAAMEADMVEVKAQLTELLRRLPSKP